MSLERVMLGTVDLVCTLMSNEFSAANFAKFSAKFCGAVCQILWLTAENCPNCAASHGVPCKSKLYRLRPSY